MDDMRHSIELYENNINCIIDITEEGDVRLIHRSSLPFSEQCINKIKKNGLNLLKYTYPAKSRTITMEQST